MQNPKHFDGPEMTASIQAQRREPFRAPPRPGLADFARRMVVAVLILGVAYLLWRGSHVLLLAFAGVLFAVFLAALSEGLSRRTGLSYGRSLAVVVVALLLVVGGFGLLVANTLTTQAAELTQKLPESFRQIREYLEEYPLGRMLLEKAPQAADSLTQAGDFSRVTGLVAGVADFLVALVVIFCVGLFGAAEPAVYKRGLLHLVPFDQRGRVEQAVDETALGLRGWILAQALLMVVMGVMTWAGLWLLGIPLALTLGLIAGTLELTPFVGAWIAAVPAALVALLMGPEHLVMTLGLYLALHLLEGYLLAPLVQRQAVHLPPALTLVAQVLLGELMGVLGLFVAAPLTVTAIVLLKRLYVEDALGDETVEGQGASGKDAAPGNARHPDSVAVTR